jgi:hypothetical protein
MSQALPLLITVKFDGKRYEETRRRVKGPRNKIMAISLAQFEPRGTLSMLSQSRLDEMLDTIVTSLVRNTEDEEDMTKRVDRTDSTLSCKEHPWIDECICRSAPGSPPAPYLLTVP